MCVSSYGSYFAINEMNLPKIYLDSVLFNQELVTEILFIIEIPNYWYTRAVIYTSGVGNTDCC